MEQPVQGPKDSWDSFQQNPVIPIMNEWEEMVELKSNHIKRHSGGVKTEFTQ